MLLVKKDKTDKQEEKDAVTLKKHVKDIILMKPEEKITLRLKLKMNRKNVMQIQFQI
jgi:hypothetical protein